MNKEVNFYSEIDSLTSHKHLNENYTTATNLFLYWQKIMEK